MIINRSVTYYISQPTFSKSVVVIPANIDTNSLLVIWGAKGLVAIVSRAPFNMCGLTAKKTISASFATTELSVDTFAPNDFHASRFLG